MEPFCGDISAEHPEVPEGLVGVIIAPVSVAVLQEDVAVFPEPVVAGAAACSCVEVEYHGAGCLLQDLVKEAAEVLLCLLSGYLEAVYLEDAYAVGAVEADDGIGILLPVGKVILDAGVVPEARFYSQFAGFFNHGGKAAGIFFRVRSPVEGVVPDVPE